MNAKQQQGKQKISDEEEENISDNQAELMKKNIQYLGKKQYKNKNKQKCQYQQKRAGTTSSLNKHQKLINTFEKSIFGTPKFPFYKWEIIFHLVHISIMLMVVIYCHLAYIQNHYDQLKTKMTQSNLSCLMKYFFNIFNKTNNQGLIFTFYRYNQDLQWQAYRSNLTTLIIIALAYKAITYAFLSKTCHKSTQIFAYTNKFSWFFGLCILIFSFRGDIVFYMGIVLGWYFYIQFLLIMKKIIVQQFIKGKFKALSKISQISEIDKNNIIQQIQYKFCVKFNQISIFSFWVIMLLTLYMNEQFDHFRGLSQWFQQFIPHQIQFMKNSHRAIHCSQLLNMTFLKLLSYGIDKIHSTDEKYLKRQKAILQEKHGQNCTSCKIYQEQCIKLTSQQSKIAYDYCYKARDLLKVQSFDLKHFNDYVLFAPTLLTGPPISYQNYHSFNRFPANFPKMPYFVYHIFLLISFQVYQHFFPIIKPTVDQTLLQMEIFAMFHLVYIWYKFLIIWRTAKVWAILYGVDVIDNMSRCMCDNYGFQGFWRMWHRGFNHWLIRYLYIPLGGNKNYFSVLAVVAFVAFWHDHNLNIILWAFLIVLCMIPQLVIKRYFRKKYPHLYTKHWFKYLSGVAASIYIYLLMICNLIGFGYGADQIEIVIQKLMNGWFQFLWTVIILTSACMLMFYKRNIQKAQKNY